MDVDLVKHVEQELRERERELRKRDDSYKNLSMRSPYSKQQIVEKNATAEIKEEMRKFVREKEEFRRQYEMENYSIKSGGAYSRQRYSRQRFRQDELRKEQELEHKKQEHARLKREIMFHEQEVPDRS